MVGGEVRGRDCRGGGCTYRRSGIGFEQDLDLDLDLDLYLDGPGDRVTERSLRAT